MADELAETTSANTQRFLSAKYLDVQLRSGNTRKLQIFSSSRSREMWLTT